MKRSTYSLNESKLSYVIAVGARSSLLSRVQVDEVYQEVKHHLPHLVFSTNYVETRGDQDRHTSLRFMDKTDFFTREIDEMLLSKKCRIAIHSAKDLPDPLAPGLKIVALTSGVDPSDSLVLGPGMTVQSLHYAAKIATSSRRREEQILRLRPDFICVDIRGNIQERLGYLHQKEIDGLVVAEAALIRLKIIGLNKIKLEGPTTPLQGKLAVVARDCDAEMENLFSSIDSRKICKERFSI